MKRKRIDWELLAMSAMIAAGIYFLVMTLIGIIKHL
jgi:hypothetical protein